MDKTVPLKSLRAPGGEALQAALKEEAERQRAHERDAEGERHDLPRRPAVEGPPKGERLRVEGRQVVQRLGGHEEQEGPGRRRWMTRARKKICQMYEGVLFTFRKE